MFEELKDLSGRFESTKTEETNYTPEYQITKLSNDAYQVYSFQEKSAEINNTNATLKKIASLRGGAYLDAKLASAVTSLDNFSSIIVTSDAMRMTKKASVNDNKEPWDLVSVNGVEYFVKAASTEDEVSDEEKEKAVKKTASVKHTYLVRVTAHNVREIAKIASSAEDKLNAKACSIEVPSQEVIVFEVDTPKSMKDLHTSIMEKLIEGGIILPDDNVQVFNDTCPCGCGKEVKNNLYDDTDCGYVLISPESEKIVTANNKETIKAYAAAHYKTYTIRASDGSIVDSGTSNSTCEPGEQSTFAKDLSNFLLDSYKSNSMGKEANKKVVVNDKGEVVSDTVEAPTNNNNRVVEVEAAAEDNENANVSQKDDGADIRRWKGLKQDEDTGKFVVYITEQEERVFDTPEEALSFMMRE